MIDPALPQLLVQLGKVLGVGACRLSVMSVGGGFIAARVKGQDQVIIHCTKLDDLL